jgi:hypothetical protein
VIPTGCNAYRSLGVKRAGVVERLSTTALHLRANPLIPNQRGLDRFAGVKTLGKLFQNHAAPLLAIATSFNTRLVADYQDRFDRLQIFGIITWIRASRSSNTFFQSGASA